MTTRVHIVNFGPDAVLVKTNPTSPKTILYAQESVNEYVYPGHEIEVHEVTKDSPLLNQLPDKG